MTPKNRGITGNNNGIRELVLDEASQATEGGGKSEAVEQIEAVVEGLYLWMTKA